MSYSQQDDKLSWIENRKLRKALDEAILQDMRDDDNDDNSCAWPDMEVESTLNRSVESMALDDDEVTTVKPGMCDAETQTPREQVTNGCPPRAQANTPIIGQASAFWLSVRYQSRVFAWRWSREMLRLLDKSSLLGPDALRMEQRIRWHVDALDDVIDRVNSHGAGYPWLEDDSDRPPCRSYGATHECRALPFNPYETFTRIGRCWCDWENWILAEVAAGRARSITYDERHQFRTPDEHWDAVRHYVPISLKGDTPPAGVPKGNCFRIGGQSCRENGLYHHRGLCFLHFGTEAEIDAEDPKHQKK